MLTVRNTGPGYWIVQRQEARKLLTWFSVAPAEHDLLRRNDEERRQMRENSRITQITHAVANHRRYIFWSHL